MRRSRPAARTVVQFLGIAGLHGAPRPIIPLTRRGGGPFRARRVHRRPRPAPERRSDARARSARPPCRRVADLSQAWTLSCQRLDRTFQIEFLDPGVQAFAVTLGWDPQESTI